MMTKMARKSVPMMETKNYDLSDTVVRLLAYRPNPDRIANWIIDGTAFTPSRSKAECLEALIKQYKSGGTIHKDGLRIALNPFKNAVANLQKKEADDDNLLIWWKMKHKRHIVEDMDKDETTMGCWTMAVYLE